MKKENGFWIDKNGNKWSALVETKESAKEKSKTLINCSDCSDCRNCSNCNGCRNCSYCMDCCFCSGCSGCRDCSHCTDCSGCSDCNYCCFCSGCRDCRNCSGFKTNPQRYITPFIGSRKSQTVFYWTSKDDIQIICGCFTGNLVLFENAVKDRHGNNEFAKQYQEEIKKVKYLIS